MEHLGLKFKDERYLGCFIGLGYSMNDAEKVELANQINIYFMCRATKKKICIYRQTELLVELESQGPF